MTLAAGPPRRVHVRAPGKVNVFFEVGPVHSDGYHDVASVYQAVSLFEDVSAVHAEDFSIAVTGDVDVSGVPVDASNLAVRAARLVAERAKWPGGIHLDVHKGVPVAGGMGGGSADAAAALVAVNELIGAGLTASALQELGARLGADVPFALLGGTAVGTGRGDELAPALARGRLDWVLVTSADGLSTPRVYGTLDALRAGADIGPERRVPSVDPRVLQAVRRGDAQALADALANDLQRAALHLRPELGDVLAEGVSHGALAGIVSGSGPTVALLCADAAAAAQVAAAFTLRGRTALPAYGAVPGARIVAVD